MTEPTSPPTYKVTSEEELDAIGGRRRQAPRRADHARRLRPALAGALRAGGGPDPVGPRRPRRRLEHTGSTSVPGLAAKPIIDIILASPTRPTSRPTSRDWRPAATSLRIREPDWYEHGVFKGPDTEHQPPRLLAGSPEIERMLAFRDWLRTHDDERELYEATKRELAARDWVYVQDYADAKGEVVEAIVARAGLGGPTARPADRRAASLTATRRQSIPSGHAHEPPTSTFDARHDRSRSLGPGARVVPGNEAEARPLLFCLAGRPTRRHQRDVRRDDRRRQRGRDPRRQEPDPGRGPDAVRPRRGGADGHRRRRRDRAAQAGAARAASRALPGVESVTPISRPFKLTSREFHPEDTVIRVLDAVIGDGSLTMMAGPCSVESREQLFETADAVEGRRRDDPARRRVQAADQPVRVPGPRRRRRSATSPRRASGPACRSSPR